MTITARIQAARRRRRLERAIVARRRDLLEQLVGSQERTSA